MLLDDVLSHGLDHEVDQSQAKGVKKYSKSAAIGDQINSAQSESMQVQAYFFDKRRYKFDLLRSLPEAARRNLDKSRFAVVYMDG